MKQTVLLFPLSFIIGNVETADITLWQKTPINWQQAKGTSEGAVEFMKIPGWKTAKRKNEHY